ERCAERRGPARTAGRTDRLDSDCSAEWRRGQGNAGAASLQTDLSDTGCRRLQVECSHAIGLQGLVTEAEAGATGFPTQFSGALLTRIDARGGHQRRAVVDANAVAVAVNRGWIAEVRECGVADGLP